MLSDLRYASRQLRRAPAFAATAVLTLGLGIGAATTVFAIVNAVALRPLAVSNVDDVYDVAISAAARPAARSGPASVFPSARTRSGLYTSLQELRWLQAHPPPTIAAIAGIQSGFSPVVQAPGHAEILTPRFITSGFADVLGVGIQAGHWPTADEEREARSTRAVVISDHLWSDWFGRRRSVIDHDSLRIGSLTFAIIGVAPTDFEPLIDLWLPLGNCVFTTPPGSLAGPCDEAPNIYVRARHGASLAELTTALGAAAIEGDPARARGVVLEPALERSRTLMPAVWMMLGLAALVLFAASANVANLLYARGLQRAAEVAVRLSLGASRARIVRMLVAETAVIAALAAALGLGLTLGALAAFSKVFPSVRLGLVRQISPEFTPDSRIWLVAFASAAFAALIVGVTTAWRTSRVESLRSLASTGAPDASVGRGGRVRTALVAVQITAAVVLVILAGMYLENMPDALRERVNFDTRQVVVGQIDLGRHGYLVVKGSKTFYGARGDAFFTRLLTEVRRLPGVDAAAVAETIPGDVGGAEPLRATLATENTHGTANDVGHRITAKFSSVSPGFLRAIDLPLRAGRDFTAADADGAPAVGIVSESAADALWPGQPAVGRRVMFGHDVWLTVVGVSADPLTSSSDTVLFQDANFLFVPREQQAQYPTSYIVLRSTTPHALADPLRAAVAAADPNVAVLDPATMDDSIFAWYGPQRAAYIFLTALGTIALLIALFGVYGVIAYFVSIRTREFGIRLALGATPRRLVRLVIDHAIHLVLVGLLSGVFVASVASRLVEANSVGAMLYPGVGSLARPTMPNGVATWVIVPLLILAAGVVAAYVPARRASRVDPNVSLREG